MVHLERLSVATVFRGSLEEDMWMLRADVWTFKTKIEDLMRELCTTLERYYQEINER